MNPRLVGATPFYPSSCQGEIAHVILEVGGEPFMLMVDTGSSNTEVASSICDTCAVSPKLQLKEAVLGPEFNMSFGTGALVNRMISTPWSLAGISKPNGTVGAIVRQDTAFGFNVFPPPASKDCYNSFAGLMGVAYSGQDAGPAANGDTTNGTTMPLIDQLVAEGMPNAFAMEFCDDYPLSCDAHRTKSSSWLPSSACGQQQVGSLLLGGYSSARVGPVQFTPITDDIHYDVQLLAVRVCGDHGCSLVHFPDKISGRTEDECSCSNDNCAPGTVNFCSFTVLDSGTDSIYLNSAANARALLERMDSVGMVSFSSQGASAEERRAFWFNGSSALNARISSKANLEFHFAGSAGASEPTIVPLSLHALFRKSEDGLQQVGVSGNLDLLTQFQHSKFPTLIGGPFFKGNMVFFDRSRRQIGIAKADPQRCHVAAVAADIDQFGANSIPTPGSGCRRGTGSGGGCNRGPWKAQMQRFRSKSFSKLQSASTEAIVV